ncbi:hypothetical protein COB52_05660 [Candidatus Kaiserbacteria bacterium]|nr:MAG: hypothetical protein COB52_05660 [Candidatus Kaiserbacteria bacterium]
MSGDAMCEQVIKKLRMLLERRGLAVTCYRGPAQCESVKSTLTLRNTQTWAGQAGECDLLKIFSFLGRSEMPVE